MGGQGFVITSPTKKSTPSPDTQTGRFEVYKQPRFTPTYTHYDGNVVVPWHDIFTSSPRSAMHKSKKRNRRYHNGESNAGLLEITLMTPTIGRSMATSNSTTWHLVSWQAFRIGYARREHTEPL